MALHQRKALKAKKEKTPLLVQHNYSRECVTDCSSPTLSGHLPQNGDLLISLTREQVSCIFQNQVLISHKFLKEKEGKGVARAWTCLCKAFPSWQGKSKGEETWLGPLANEPSGFTSPEKAAAQGVHFRAVQFSPSHPV